MRSLLNGSASTTISRRLQSEIRSLGLLVAAGLVVVGLVTWRKGSRQGVATLWKL